MGAAEIALAITFRSNTAGIQPPRASVRNRPVARQAPVYEASLVAPQFIYVMKDLRKVVPPSREILRGI